MTTRNVSTLSKCAPGVQFTLQLRATIIKGYNHCRMEQEHRVGVVGGGRRQLMSHSAFPSSPVFLSLMSLDRSQRIQFYSLQDTPSIHFKTKSQQAIIPEAPQTQWRQKPFIHWCSQVLMKIASGSPEISYQSHCQGQTSASCLPLFLLHSNALLAISRYL